jgi:transcriptional regulator with XRE-family HTH domain
MHELFSKGVAARRQDLGWTQEQTARAFRSHGLHAWRTSTVGSLEAGLRKPRLDEMLLMARALGVTLDKLIPGGDDERVDLGDDGVVSPRWVREMLSGDFFELSLEEMPYEQFPIYDILAEIRRRAEAERDRDAPLVEAISQWAKQHDVRLKSGDIRASYERPSDAERHAAQRLGVEISPLKLAARTLWDHRNFNSERDRRVGNVDELPPRSRQARRRPTTFLLVRAEGVGFEPTRTRQRPNGFQDHRHRPLGEPS